ncbi:hypothetical protein LAZ67_20001369 [Cordylochernes scorpioides]|uniref:Uncharacterized protein n=1 Tax=Cordylochernes scorpioides TaxID=51811 RepID=A0ABY6LK33_9ARAC|nr:hypothetical protein LAZ67_20001369 [Cordylochernes scorpioides]
MRPLPQEVFVSCAPIRRTCWLFKVPGIRTKGDRKVHPMAPNTIALGIRPSWKLNRHEQQYCGAINRNPSRLQFYHSQTQKRAVVVEAEWKAWECPYTKNEDTVALRKFREQIKVELGAKDGDRRFLTDYVVDEEDLGYNRRERTQMVNGQLNLNAVARRSKMTHVKGGQKLKQHTKQSIIYSTILCRTIGNREDIGRKGAEHLERRIRDTKALLKACSTFAECRSKANA